MNCSVRPQQFIARVRARSRSCKDWRGEGGFTLIETSASVFVAAVLLTVMAPFLISTTDSLTASGKLVTAQAEARLAIESMQLQVESASQVCLPSTYSSQGFSLRVLQIVSTSDSEGSLSDEYRWDQWELTTSSQTLREEFSAIQSNDSNTGITWTGGWQPIATGIVNSADGGSPTPPFSLVAPATGSPQGLAVNLVINGGTPGSPGTMQLTTDYAAFATPYSDAGTYTSAGAPPCLAATPDGA